MEEAHDGLDGFAVIIDDLLVFDSTLEEGNKQLVAVLERAKGNVSSSTKRNAAFVRKVKAEQKYSQLEKELYAIVFGCKYFHHFIYGRHVKITTDHRPLETILRNPLQKASARVQSMILHIQSYDPEFSYRPGTKIEVADNLSRLHLPEIDEKIHREIKLYLHQIACVLPISYTRLEEIRLHTKEDEHLIHLREAIQGR
ncbi:hypothetical protein QYM36_007402 [Artemia franciscana]|uniref:Reverse transcriptase RNase H-like domain-containing protein n=1 Tax=Artemia franciscana TaxID=6661 RepID=A0AA88HZR9_ARTSF|nr:hypothetical protein QYM36_007402 [Artemia franciscana]